MLIVMDESTHEEHLSHPLQTNSKQFKIAITFLTAYNGISNVTNKNKKFYLTRPINDMDFSKISIPPRAYERETLNNEIKRINIEEGYLQKLIIHLQSNQILILKFYYRNFIKYHS